MTKQDKLEPVSKGMMEELNTVKDKAPVPARFFDLLNKGKFESINDWLLKDLLNSKESEFAERKRKLLLHIYWDEPQFEGEELKKFIVKTKELDSDTEYWYLSMNDFGLITLSTSYPDVAYRFETREEAEKWTNPQTEVVEVEE